MRDLPDATAALSIQVVWLGMQGKSDAVPLSREEMRPHIVWRAFYVNPNDPRGWVPKTYGTGYAVSFRTITQARSFAALIVLTLATKRVSEALSPSAPSSTHRNKGDE